MESMDADYYVIEFMVRERLLAAREKGRVAALLMDARRGQGRSAVDTRFTHLRRELVKGMRKVAGEIFHVIPGRTRIAKLS
jgi:hypothetical protein